MRMNILFLKVTRKITPTDLYLSVNVSMTSDFFFTMTLDGEQMGGVCGEKSGSCFICFDNMQIQNNLADFNCLKMCQVACFQLCLHKFLSVGFPTWMIKYIY